MSNEREKLFCEMNPLFYKISLQKEIMKRHLEDMSNKTAFASKISDELLPVTISSHSSGMIKRAPGIDPELQYNKAHNINLSCKCFNGLIIMPGETFSFWKLVGNTTKSKGYKDGRIISNGKIKPGIGGGLCNLANTLHLLVLDSPLTVTEFHNHSDALAPDEGPRVPFATGTSVSYNNIDYRFRNDTSQKIQLVAYCEGETLNASLLSEKEFPWRYELFEEDHHFKKEDGIFYRNSKIYRNTIDRKTGEILKTELLLDNHSEVMFDYDLIPKELIRD